jgi:hypothetical protein
MTTVAGWLVPHRPRFWIVWDRSLGTSLLRRSVTPDEIPRTTSNISFNISDADGSQDCLFAPISTTYSRAALKFRTVLTGSYPRNSTGAGYASGAVGVFNAVSLCCHLASYSTSERPAG